MYKHFLCHLVYSLSNESLVNISSKLDVLSRKWWCTLLFPIFGRQRQTEICDSAASLVCIESSRRARLNVNSKTLMCLLGTPQERSGWPRQRREA